MWNWLVETVGLADTCGAGTEPARVSVSDLLNRADRAAEPDGPFASFWAWATDREPTFSIDRISEACPALVPNRLGIESAITESARYWNARFCRSGRCWKARRPSSPAPRRC